MCRRFNIKKYLKEMAKGEYAKIIEKYTNGGAEISEKVLIQTLSQMLNDFIYKGFTIALKGSDTMICRYFSGQYFKVTAKEIKRDEDYTDVAEDCDK